MDWSQASGSGGSRNHPYLPRSTSASSTLSTSNVRPAEEFELASPPQPQPRALGSQSTSNLAEQGNAPSARSPRLERARGLSIHQLARQPTSLLFETFHSSPTAARRALPLNFTQDDDVQALRSSARAEGVGGGEDDEDEGADGSLGRRASGVLHGLGMDDDTWDTARKMKSQWKRRIFLLLEEPTSSEEALWVHWGVTFLIVFSAVLTVLSTLPGVHINKAFSRALFGMDTTVVCLFTVEYVLRLIGHSDSFPMFYGWFLSFLGIIDLLSIGPYFIELLLHADTSVMFRFSIMRTFRLLRVFRAFRYSNTVILTIETMRIAIRLSQDALLALAFFIIMVVIIFSTLLYFAERGSWDDVLQSFVDSDGIPTNFGSIPAAAWFILCTIATVGYGDITPRSTLGRICTIPLLAFGLLLIALPSFVLGRNFSIVWDHLRTASSDGRGGGVLYASPHSPRTSEDGGDPTVGEDDITRGVSGRSSMEDLGPTTSNGYATVAGGQSTGLATLPMGSPDRSSSTAPRKRVRIRDPSEAAQDLSNLKLAKNQEALSAQIDGLREVVESQGRLVARLLEALDSAKTSYTRA